MTDTEATVSEAESKLYRELARAIFAFDGDKADADARKEKWEAEKAERMKAARQIVRRLEEAGIKISA